MNQVDDDDLTADTEYQQVGSGLVCQTTQSPISPLSTDYPKSLPHSHLAFLPCKRHWLVGSSLNSCELLAILGRRAGSKRRNCMDVFVQSTQPCAKNPEVLNLLNLLSLIKLYLS